jgi:hypothetical protein
MAGTGFGLLGSLYAVVQTLADSEKSMQPVHAACTVACPMRACNCANTEVHQQHANNQGHAADHTPNFFAAWEGTCQAGKEFL